MGRVSVRDVRENLRAYLERAEAGEEIVVVRRGKEVARIVPPRSTPQQFPDLTDFRTSIGLRGEPMSETVIQQRRESRF